MIALLWLGSIFEWFATTRVGQIVGLIGLAAGMIFIVFLKGKAAGRRSEIEKQEKELDRQKKIGEKVDVAVDSMPDDAVDAELRKWSKAK